MAVLPTLLLILGASTVNAVSIGANDKPVPVMRQQAMQVDASGTMQSLVKTEETPESTPKDQQHVGLKELTETQCNRQYLLMAAGTDTCTGSGNPSEIFSPQKCKHAASELGKDELGDFMLTTHTVNPLPYPKGCFVNTKGLVAFNPSESTPSTIEGQKICMRSKYIAGTANTANTQAASACSGDAQQVATAEACWEASVCVAGGDACKLLEFKENRTTEYDTKPAGCFRDHDGCFGFNSKTDPAGTIEVDNTAECHNIVPDAGTGAR